MFIRKIFRALSCALLLMIAPSALFAGQDHQSNTNLYGSDYKNFALSPDDPKSIVRPPYICEQNCVKDEKCKAWTAVNAGLQGSTAHCWLKYAIPRSIASSCCQSGVPIREFESNINRYGGDYESRDIVDLPAVCKSACEQEGRKCKAWTYVKKGIQGPQAKCWLKSSIPAASTNSCCISGAHFIRTPVN